MSKRFIDPDWKQLRLLPGYLQRAWFYMWDKADEAGVYHYDKEYFKLDLKLSEDVGLGALGSLPDCEILPGERILIKNFLSVNYKNLKPDYNPHKPVFRALNKNGLILNSSFNQASMKLEEEGEEEGEEEKERGQGETIPVDQDFLIPKMAKSFQDENPKYPAAKESDFPALGEICQKIIREIRCNGDLLESKTKEIVLTRWGELVRHIKADPHLCKYSLTQINKYFQSVVQSFNNGGHKKTGGQGGSYKPVITGRAEGAGTF